jgi:hypothetical protein
VSRRLALVTSPQSPRERHLLDCAQQLGLQVHLVPWPTLIDADGELEPWLPPGDEELLLKLEAPSCEEALLALIRAGQRERGEPSRPVPPLAPGEMRSPGLRHDGFARVLRGVQRSLARLPHVAAYNAPQDILEMSSKGATSRRLRAANVRCPTGFTPSGHPSIGVLWQLIEARGWACAYLKLDGGSCGSGIVRLDLQRRSGLSTVVLRQGAFVGVRPVLLRDQELERAVTFLLTEGAWLEHGLQHARLGPEHLDLRVIVLDGEARFLVGRASRWPLTNLSLGGRRASREEVERGMGRRAWLDARDLAVAAAGVWQARAVGVDVLVDRGGRAHVLELNPFGDFFPGLTDTDGHTVHEVQLSRIGRAPGARTGEGSG